MKISVSVIIPIFNEEHNISKVLDVVCSSPSISEIICVNDGSTDNSQKIVEARKNVILIKNELNQGKAHAIVKGIRKATGDIILLLDGDLRGLTEQSLQQLLFPLLRNTADVTVGYPSQPLDKMFKPISGQRAYFKHDLFPLLDEIEKKGYGLELYLNFALRNRRVKSIMLTGVSHIQKLRKYPWKKAVASYFMEMKEIMSEIFFQSNPFFYFTHTYLYPFYFQKQQVRVLFVFDSLSPIGGGSQVAALAWMKNLTEKGFIVKILCNKNAPLFLKELSEDSIIGLPFLNLHALFPHYYPTVFLSKKIQEQIQRFSPDIIHIHEPTFFAIQVAKFAKKNRIKTVFSFQTDYKKQFSSHFPLSLLLGKRGLMSFLLYRQQMSLCSLVDLVTVPTRNYQKYVSALIEKQTHVLILPIHTLFYTEKKQVKAVPRELLCIARLIGNKHVDVLIHMMSYLKDSFHLTLIGDGPDREYLYALIRKLRLSDVITLKQWVQLDLLPAEFANTDIYLSASDSETFGLTYVSSLATHTPCIVYNYPVSKEIISDSCAIFLSSLEPHVWADTLIQLQKNPGTYTQLLEGIQSEYPRIKQYDEKHSTGNLASLYTMLLKRME